jgi:hypothetical protein
MDSRIREIEQRLGRAREGLAEGGREDYLKQLYLLDAEIRAVIRENGSLPEHLRELLQDAAPRRRKSPLRTAGMALALMLVVAGATFGVAWLNTGAATAPAVTAGLEPAAETAAEQSASRTRPALERAGRLAGLNLAWRSNEDRGASAADSQEHTQQAEMTQAGTRPAPTEDTAAEKDPAPMVLASAAQKTAATTATAVEESIPVTLIPPPADTPDHNGITGPADPRQAASQNPLDQPNLVGSPGVTGFDWTIARFALPDYDQNKNKDQAIVVVEVAETAAARQEQTGAAPASSDSGEITVVDKRLSTSDKKVDN